ncbi:hypothetical protein BPAE_0189g00220 [Botrytis paeoniae]|uniref:Uncharacterized protein n=1 Tax=Botrytis paeoniae TaxID=278948 RepID=A0A4Z1FEN3_9HELO|nr:hypothetical protein BPAE_0189g00220 [Botrytis paeoniae]
MGKQKKVPGAAEEIDIELPFRNADVPKESESSASFDKLREDSQKKIKNLAKEIDVQLFNASALMESRASTRLGENVKLLTYDSIFYLPLAIPNITSSGTRDPFILTTIIVGFVIYMIVFNLCNVVNQWKRLYKPYRSKVIKQVCRQGSNDITSRKTQQTGSLSTLSLPQTPTESPVNEFKSGREKRTKRFESTFGRKRGDREPSEWWISIG